MISLSRRATLASAALLVSGIAAGLATVAPPASAATAAPTVSGGSALGLGATKWPYFAVMGTGFVSGATVTFTTPATAASAALGGGTGAANTDVTQDAGTTSVASTDGKTLTVEVTVAAKATEALDVSVTNPGGTAVSCYVGALGGSDAGCVTIEAAPSALVFPAGVGVGAVNHATAFTATGLVKGPGMIFSPDTTPTFTAKAFTIAAGDKGESPQVSVPTTAKNQPGNNVTLVNGDGGRVTAAALTITTPPSFATSKPITPATGDAGHDLTVSVSGSGFETSPAAPTVTFLGQSHPASATPAPTSTSFTVDLGTIPAGTSGGKAPLTVTNGDGGTDNEPNLVTVVGAPGAPPAVSVSNVGDGTATVTWSPVSDAANGGAPISSYTVTTTPDTGPHPVPANQPLTLALTGLTDGSSYTATVTATNTDAATTVAQTGAGTVSMAFTPMAAAAPASGTVSTSLPPPVIVTVPMATLKASKTTINFASPVTISGKLLLSGVPVSNTLVHLQTIGAKGARNDTGETATTHDDGTFSFGAVFPSYTTTFGIGVGSTTTSGVKVVVTQYLLLTKKTLAKTGAYVVTGLGTPGTTDKKATVVLFKVTKSGHRVGTITKTLLARGKSAKGYSAGISTFTLKTTLKHGSYLVAVAVLGTSTNGPVQSKPFTVTVP